MKIFNLFILMAILLFVQFRQIYSSKLLRTLLMGKNPNLYENDLLTRQIISPSNSVIDDNDNLINDEFDSNMTFSNNNKKIDNDNRDPDSSSNTNQHELEDLSTLSLWYQVALNTYDNNIQTIFLLHNTIISPQNKKLEKLLNGYLPETNLDKYHNLLSKIVTSKLTESRSKFSSILDKHSKLYDSDQIYSDQSQTLLKLYRSRLNKNGGINEWSTQFILLKYNLYKLKRKLSNISVNERYHFEDEIEFRQNLYKFMKSSFIKLLNELNQIETIQNDQINQNNNNNNQQQQQQNINQNDGNNNNVGNDNNDSTVTRLTFDDSNSNIFDKNSIFKIDFKTFFFLRLSEFQRSVRTVLNTKSLFEYKTQELQKFHKLTYNSGSAQIVAADYDKSKDSINSVDINENQNSIDSSESSDSNDLIRSLDSTDSFDSSDLSDSSDASIASASDLYTSYPSPGTQLGNSFSSWMSYKFQKWRDGWNRLFQTGQSSINPTTVIGSQAQSQYQNPSMFNGRTIQASMDQRKQYILKQGLGGWATAFVNSAIDADQENNNSNYDYDYDNNGDNIDNNYNNNNDYNNVNNNNNYSYDDMEYEDNNNYNQKVNQINDRIRLIKRYNLDLKIHEIIENFEKWFKTHSSKWPAKFEYFVNLIHKCQNSTQISLIRTAFLQWVKNELNLIQLNFNKLILQQNYLRQEQIKI